MSQSGTVRHVVLVKFRKDISETQRARFIERSQWSRYADYVYEYTCGSGVQPNPYAGIDEWDWGMTLDIAAADVERYRDDPVHQVVGREVAGFAERYAILDFVVD